MNSVSERQSYGPEDASIAVDRVQLDPTFALFPPAEQGRSERTFHESRILLRGLIQRDDIGYADAIRDARDLLNRVACREVPLLHH